MSSLSQLARGVGAALTLGSGPRRRTGAAAVEVGLDQPFLELGLDSLMAMGLRNQIRTQLGVTLPIATLLQGASVRRVTEQILERLAAGEETGPAAPPQADDETAALLADLERLPEDEARALLSEGR
nr:hypothetical protein GCM10020092_080010 [Actinoplanes digitatis]